MRTILWTLCAVVFVASCGPPLHTIAPSVPTNSPSTPSPSVTDPRSVLLTGAEAIERVVAFVDSPELTSDLTVGGLSQGALIPFYDVRGREVSATVNAHDGTIASLLLFGSVGSGGSTIDAGRAATVAEEFLTQRNVSFAGLDQTVQLQDHGDTSEYVVEWVGHEGEVIVPNSREVGVDAATGRVSRYAYTNRPYDPPPEPQIDRTTAEATAFRTVNGSPQAQISRSELRVQFVPFDVQRLVWHVYVDDGISHAIVEVDAETGAASVIARG